MIVRLRIVVVAAGLALAGCGQTQGASLEGIWLGDSQPGTDNVVYLIEFRGDGTFNSEFRQYDGCTVAQNHIETGTWTMDGEVQEIVTTEVDGRAANFVNRYTIELLTEAEQHARSDRTGHLFVARRVPAFEFPPCNPT